MKMNARRHKSRLARSGHADSDDVRGHRGRWPKEEDSPGGVPSADGLARALGQVGGVFLFSSPSPATRASRSEPTIRERAGRSPSTSSGKAPTSNPRSCPRTPAWAARRQPGAQGRTRLRQEAGEGS